MNEEELNLIASSYLDGEATPAEVAMVERDPALGARVEQFRSLQQAMSVSAPAAVKEQHLAAARAAFSPTGRIASEPTHSDLGQQSPGSNDPDSKKPDSDIIDLNARRERAQNPASKRLGFLSAAAVALVFAGGAVFAASRNSPTLSGAETEVAIATQADSAADDEASMEQAGEMVEFEAGSAAMADGDDAMASDDAESDLLTTPTEADADIDTLAEMSPEADETADAMTDETADEKARRYVPSDGFFPGEPTNYATTPSEADLLNNKELIWLDVETSNCATTFVPDQPGDLVSYVPLEVVEPDPQIFEALNYLTPDGHQVFIVDATTCTLGG